MQRYLFTSLGIGLFCASFALADQNIALNQIVPDATPTMLQRALLEEHPLLQGDYSGSYPLASSWCQSGAWSYRLAVTSPLNNLDMSLQEDNSLDVKADLGNIDGHVEGSLRSRWTLCQEVGVSSPFGADGAQVAAKVTFVGEPTDLANAKVRILSTHLDRIHFLSWVPTPVQDLLTDVANQALEYLWKTRLGDWIGDFIAKKLKEGGLPIGGTQPNV